MRTIKFKLMTQVQLLTIKSDAVTFGELKAQILNSDIKDKINFDNTKFFERNTQAEFGSIDGALLPQGDLLFFTSPTKTDSGMSDFHAVLAVDELKELSYNEIRSYISKLNKINSDYFYVNLSGSKEEIIEKYKHEYFNKSEITKDNKEGYNEDYNEDINSQSDEVEPSVSVKDMLENALKLIENVIKALDNDVNKYAIDGVTYTQLEKEAEELRAQLRKLPGWYKVD